MCKIPNERIQQRAHVGAPKQSAPIRTKLMVGIFLIALGVDMDRKPSRMRTKEQSDCVFFFLMNLQIVGRRNI